MCIFISFQSYLLRVRSLTSTPDVNGFVPCTNQDEINRYINAVIPFFESHHQISAYAYSNGLGLGDVWPLIAANGELRCVEDIPWFLGCGPDEPYFSVSLGRHTFKLSDNIIERDEIIG